MGNSINEKINGGLEKIKRSPTIKKAIDWYTELPARDAQIVKILGGLIVITLIITWLIKPIIDGKNTAQSTLSSELKFHHNLKENAYLLGSSSDSSSSGGSILSMVNSLAKAKGVQLKRFEPEGKGGLRIWLEKVNFDSAIDWLELMESEKGISIDQISIDKVDNGVVNIRAVLKR
jgi:type II secretory pathway component PulM